MGCDDETDPATIPPKAPQAPLGSPTVPPPRYLPSTRCCAFCAFPHLLLPSPPPRPLPCTPFLRAATLVALCVRAFPQPTRAATRPHGLPSARSRARAEPAPPHPPRARARPTRRSRAVDALFDALQKDVARRAAASRKDRRRAMNVPRQAAAAPAALTAQAAALAILVAVRTGSGSDASADDICVMSPSDELQGAACARDTPTAGRWGPSGARNGRRVDGRRGNGVTLLPRGYRAFSLLPRDGGATQRRRRERAARNELCFDNAHPLHRAFSPRRRPSMRSSRVAERLWSYAQSHSPALPSCLVSSLRSSAS